ncbi:serine--tRNA ligase, partial [Acidithiobacillus ferrivorans]|nr:serine--tRNA ligase [Acidithiobacillus ferrivorans]
MLDPSLLRSAPEKVAAGLARRHFTLDVTALSTLDQQRKTLQIQLEELRNARNEASRQIGQVRRQGLDTSAMQIAAAQHGEEIKTLEQSLESILAEWESLTSNLPNIPQDSVPDGRDERDNVVLRHWGTPRAFDFSPHDHVDLGEALGIIDFAAG